MRIEGAFLVLVGTATLSWAGPFATTLQDVLVGSATPVGISCNLPLFDGSLAYGLEDGDGLAMGCARLGGTALVCNVTLASAGAALLHLYEQPVGDAAARAYLDALVLTAYDQPEVASVAPAGLPLSGGTRLHLTLAQGLRTARYVSYGAIRARFVHRGTGDYVDADLELDGPDLLRLTGRSPATRGFAANDVADVLLTLNGETYVATSHAVSFAVATPIKVGFLYVSAPDDFGWTFQHNLARLELERRFFGQIETVTQDHVEEWGPNECDFCAQEPGWNASKMLGKWDDEPDNYFGTHRASMIIRRMVEEEGCRMIFATSWYYHWDTYHMAAKYPDVGFVHTGGWLTRPNMAQVFPRIYQARYLSGIAMAWYIRSNDLPKRIGYVSSFSLGETVRAINALKLGLEQVDPEIEIYLIWAFSWFNPRNERIATQRLIHFYGVEGVAQHTDSRQPQLTAQAEGKVGTGYNTDMLLTVGDTVLTSPVLVWSPDYAYLLQKILDNDTNIEETLWGGLSTGSWRLSDLSPRLPAEARLQIEEEMERLRAGEDRIFCRLGLRDNRGRVRNGPTNPAVNPVPWEAQHVVPGTTCLTAPVVNQVCQEYDGFSCVDHWLLEGIHDNCAPSPARPQGITSPDLPNGTCFLGGIDLPDACAEGEFLDIMGCTPARLGHYARAEEELPCPRGYYAPTAGMHVCEPCATGKASQHEGAVSCDGCEPGWYADSAGTSECEPCPVGLHMEQGNATQCDFCPEGQFAAATGMLVCTSCPSSMTTRRIASTDNSSCVCGLGTYSETGEDTCRACPSGSVTEAINSIGESSCLCTEGTYLPRAGGVCTPCPAALTCARGSCEANYGLFLGVGLGDLADSQQYPQLIPGYFSTAVEPMSVYQCVDRVACPGGRPGDCGGGRAGLVCNRCPDGEVLENSVCVPCDSTGIIWGTLALLGCTIALAAVHSALNNPLMTTQRTSMTAVNTAGMAVATVLTFNIYATLDNLWVSPLSEFFGALRLVTFDLEMLKFSCVAGTSSLLPRYIVKLLAIPIGFLLLVMSAVLLYAVPFTTKYSRLTYVDLQNSIGFLVSVFFIAVSLLSIEGFLCLDHPNGKSSLIMDRSVVCWEGEEHTDVVIVSILAFLVYPLPFLALTGLATWKYAAWAHTYGTRFTSRVRFLVNRMTPDHYYMGFWYNCRSFCLALVPLIASAAYGLQVFLLMFIFVVWLLLQLHWKPWRFPVLNAFDAFNSAMQILLLNCFSLLQTDGTNAEATTRNVGWIIICLFVVLMVVLLAASAWKLAQRFGSNKDFGIFISHHKAGAGLFARWVRMLFEKQANRPAFLDVDQLGSLDELHFIVRTNSENLLVLMTKETLTRFWCAMEIVSGFSNGVPVLLAQVVEEDVSLTEQFLGNVPMLWSSTELLEFSKVGVSTADIEAAYRHVATLKPFHLPISSSCEVQLGAMDAIVASCKNCLASSRLGTLDPECLTYLCYDTKSPVQLCVAHVMRELFLQARWKCELMWFEQHVEKLIKAVGVVLLSGGLAKNPVSLGHLIALRRKGVPCMSVLSQEDFTTPDKCWISELERSGVFRSQEAQQLAQIAPGSTGEEAADTLMEQYKRLAWRISPHENEEVMRAQFKRILDRVSTKFQGHTDQIIADRINASTGGEGNSANASAGTQDDQFIGTSGFHQLTSYVAVMM